MVPIAADSVRQIARRRDRLAGCVPHIVRYAMTAAATYCTGARSIGA